MRYAPVLQFLSMVISSRWTFGYLWMVAYILLVIAFWFAFQPILARDLFLCMSPCSKVEKVPSWVVLSVRRLVAHTIRRVRVLQGLGVVPFRVADLLVDALQDGLGFRKFCQLAKDASVCGYLSWLPLDVRRTTTHTQDWPPHVSIGTRGIPSLEQASSQLLHTARVIAVHLLLCISITMTGTCRLMLVLREDVPRYCV